MLVVSDTSPIRAFAHLDLLDLLPRLFDEILIVPAVQKELLQPPSAFRPLAPEKLAFARVATPQADQTLELLRQELDQGEAEAIALALQLKAEAILIDELRGRSVARRHALNPIGTLGLLEQAKRAGLIPALRPKIERLVGELRFFLSPELVESVLQRLGE